MGVLVANNNYIVIMHGHPNNPLLKSLLSCLLFTTAKPENHQEAGDDDKIRRIGATCIRRQPQMSTTSSLSMFMKYKSCFFFSLEYSVQWNHPIYVTSVKKQAAIAGVHGLTLYIFSYSCWFPSTWESFGGPDSEPDHNNGRCYFSANSLSDTIPKQYVPTDLIYCFLYITCTLNIL